MPPVWSMVGDMTRICRRNACARPATSTLTFRYDTAQAWLSDLADEADPLRWDLCPTHAERLTVPKGWELVDARTDGGAVQAETGARHDHVGVGRPVRSTRSTRTNRYAELSARLPELAAQMTASSPLLRDSAEDADVD